MRGHPTHPVRAAPDQARTASSLRRRGQKGKEIPKDGAENLTKRMAALRCLVDALAGGAGKGRKTQRWSSFHFRFRGADPPGGKCSGVAGQGAQPSLLARRRLHGCRGRDRHNTSVRVSIREGCTPPRSAQLLWQAGECSSHNVKQRLTHQTQRLTFMPLCAHPLRCNFSPLLSPVLFPLCPVLCCSLLFPAGTWVISRPPCALWCFTFCWTSYWEKATALRPGPPAATVAATLRRRRCLESTPTSCWWVSAERNAVRAGSRRLLSPRSA